MQDLNGRIKKAVTYTPVMFNADMLHAMSDFIGKVYLMRYAQKDEQPIARKYEIDVDYMLTLLVQHDVLNEKGGNHE
jgi:hypothetical protein